MNFNFEKHIKNPVKKLVIGGRIVSSTLTPQESPAPITMDPAKDTEISIEQKNNAWIKRRLTKEVKWN